MGCQRVGSLLGGSRRGRADPSGGQILPPDRVFFPVGCLFLGGGGEGVPHLPPIRVVAPVFTPSQRQRPPGVFGSYEHPPGPAPGCGHGGREFPSIRCGGGARPAPWVHLSRTPQMLVSVCGISRTWRILALCLPCLTQGPPSTSNRGGREGRAHVTPAGRGGLGCKRGAVFLSVVWCEAKRRRAMSHLSQQHRIPDIDSGPIFMITPRRFWHHSQHPFQPDHPSLQWKQECPQTTNYASPQFFLGIWYPPNSWIWGVPLILGGWLLSRPQGLKRSPLPPQS